MQICKYTCQIIKMLELIFIRKTQSVNTAAVFHCIIAVLPLADHMPRRRWYHTQSSLSIAHSIIEMYIYIK